ncbi:hypothetical protein [Winogradskyella forsetii]|uniref:hypothetical protein n=1 Tax=Winogradskyella forsetii TaxID=2686077 RepID=UPI0015C887C0|nr:hypothetical protein [Winogradskyella forsetii]
MTEIEVIRYVMGSPKSYKSVFEDMESYARWWPIDTNYVSEETISIMPIAPFAIHLKKMHTTAKNTVEYRYIKGPLRGQGRWIFQDINGENYFKISYYINVKGLTPMISLFAKSALFEQIHKKNVEKIIREAERLVIKNKRYETEKHTF